MTYATMTLCTGFGPASQLTVHPGAPLLSLIPPLTISRSQSLTYIFLIILLPALSGSPSPAITPDNCELSGGHRQQSGRQHLRHCPCTSQCTASVDIALPSSPSPPWVPQADLVPWLLWKAGKLAGLQAGGIA